MKDWYAEPLGDLMPNTLCLRLYLSVKDAMETESHGDFIDRALIIRRKLEEAGFDLYLRDGFEP